MKTRPDMIEKMLILDVKNQNAFVAIYFFSKITFSKTSFRNTIRVSNSLDADQDRHSVGPDLGPNCLHRLSTDDKSSL